MQQVLERIEAAARSEQPRTYDGFDAKYIGMLSTHRLMSHSRVQCSSLEGLNLDDTLAYLV